MALVEAFREETVLGGTTAEDWQPRITQTGKLSHTPFTHLMGCFIKQVDRDGDALMKCKSDFIRMTQGWTLHRCGELFSLGVFLMQV